MTTDLVAGLREAVQANRRFEAASFYDSSFGEIERSASRADLWLRSHASAIADEMEQMATDLRYHKSLTLLNRDGKVMTQSQANILMDYYDKYSELKAENARLRAEVERLQKELKAWKQEAKETERAAAIQARWDARNEANNEPYGTY